MHKRRSLFHAILSNHHSQLQEKLRKKDDSGTRDDILHWNIGSTSAITVCAAANSSLSLQVSSFSASACHLNRLLSVTKIFQKKYPHKTDIEEKRPAAYAILIPGA
jgi:hypothetical protein